MGKKLATTVFMRNADQRKDTYKTKKQRANMMPQYEKKLLDKEMKEQFDKTLKSIKMTAPKVKKVKKVKRRASYA